MANIPYGAAAEEPNADDAAWTKLATINEHLEAGEVIPPDLARWLGGAIAFSGNSPDELLRRLGLKRRRGAVVSDPDGWRIFGKRVCQLEDADVAPEVALSRVLSENDAGDQSDETVTRSTLQRWRDQYRAAERLAKHPT